VDTQNQAGKAKKLNASGKEAAGKGDFQKAAVFFEKASEIYESIDDSINMGLELFSLGSCYHTLKKNDQALFTYQKAYNLIESNETLKELKAMILNNIGHLCVGSKNYKKAVSSFEKAYKIYENEKNENGKALQLQNIGSVHRDLKESKKALEAYFKSVSIFEKTGNRLGHADQCTNIAYIYAVDNNGDKALKWYKKAFNIYVDIHEDEKANLTKKNIMQLEK